MTDPPKRRPVGAPPKVVTDEARAAKVMEELRAADYDIREATRRRLLLAHEANELGVTMSKIGNAVGVSDVAVSKWIKAARESAQDA
jgi:hypothetical protein